MSNRFIRNFLIGTILVVGFCEAVFSAVSFSLQSDLDTIFKKGIPSQSHWSVLIEDLNADKPTYSLNPKLGLLPASNMKILICTACLLRLGPTYSYATQLNTTGEIVGTTLKGNLVVVGSGDPGIGGRFNNGDSTFLFRKWAGVLKQKNIQTITGEIIGVDDLFDDTRHGLNWDPDEFIDWYAAEISALSLNDACLDITLQGAARAGNPAIINLNPPTRYLEIVNKVRTVDNRSQGDAVSLERDPDSKTLTIKGSIATRRSTLHYAAIPNPTLYFATVMKETLEQEGIKVQGSARDSDGGKPNPDKKTWQLLDTYQSPPLSQYIEVCLKNSQNLYAETFLKTLGAHEYGVGSLETGAMAVKDILFESGCDLDDQYIADGSGLSRESRVSAAALVRTLRTIEKSPYAEVFHESLPRAGVDGTLERRMRNSATYRKVIAKTGTLNGVRSLSGFIYAKSGKTYVFSMLANGPHSAGRFTKMMDDACEIISSEG